MTTLEQKGLELAQALLAMRRAQWGNSTEVSTQDMIALEARAKELLAEKEGRCVSGVTAAAPA